MRVFSWSHLDSNQGPPDYAKSSQGFEWEGDYEITGGGWKHIILEISEGKIAAN